MEIVNDEKLVAMIMSGGNDREKALRQIYLTNSIKQKLTAMITNNNGNIQDAEDMYQEAIIVLDRNIREGNYRLDGTISSYLFSTGKFLWMNHLRKKRLTLKENFTDADLISTSIQPDKIFISEEKKKVLQNVLARLGERCQNILALWQLSYSMEEIAQKLGLSDASAARKAKYDCQQQLIKFIHSSPGTLDDLK